MRRRESARPPTEQPAPERPYFRALGPARRPCERAVASAATFLHKVGFFEPQVDRAGSRTVLLAAAVRLLPALFGYEHYGDAPVRIEIAERWAAEPHLWRGFTETYQYGPLHLTLIGALVRLFGDRVFAARLLSFACGLACVYLLYLLANRERGSEAAFWAALGLAFSPLHIQASTTGASE